MKRKEKKRTTLRVETRLQGPAWLEREVKKANEQEDQLDWRKKEKREAVGLAGRMGKTKGAKGMAGQREGEVEGRRRHIA